jgi:hypothetical protein
MHRPHTTSRASLLASTMLAVAAVTAVHASPLAGDDAIVLVGGDVLRGSIVSETDESVVLDHPALGRIEVRRERIASVERSAPAKSAAPAVVVAPEAAAGVAAAATPPAEPAPAPVPVAVLPAPAPPEPPKPDGSWKFALDLGFTGSKNDETSAWNLRTVVTAKRVSELDRTVVSAEYFYATGDGANTDNNLLVRGLQEWLFKDSKWELFAQGNYQYDEFQGWEQRIGAYAGPGYRLLDEGPLALKARAGAGASYEFPSSTWTPELLIADELVWTIDERSKLKQALEFYPDIYNFGEFRFIARIDYEIALNAKGDLKGTVGARDEYDSLVENTGESANDIKVYAGIKYEF